MRFSRTINRRGAPAALLTILGLAVPVARGTGTWSDAGGSTFFGNVAASYTANLPVPLCNSPGNPFTCTDARTLNSFQTGYAGYDYGAGVGADAPNSYGLPTCPPPYPPAGCRVSGHALAFTTVNGLGSGTLAIRWDAFAHGYHNCECAGYNNCGGAATLNTTIRLRVDTVPPGQPVTIYYAWWSFIHCLFDPEAGAEDPANAANISLQILGTELIPARFQQINGVGALVLLPPASAPNGVIVAQGGDIITIAIGGGVNASVAAPPKTLLDNYDESMANYRGELILSIDAPITIANPATAPGGFASFSVDIGSDTEMSDPNSNGNEVFDPGDLYPWNGPLLPPGGASGPRDDTEIFLTDYWPTAPDGPPPTTGAQTCAGKTPSQIQQILADRFDLDGTDQLDFSLIGLIDPNQPLLTPLPQFDSNCVYKADHLVVSFNDDATGHYAGTFCDVPVGSLSPNGFTYGTHLAHDELVGVDVDVLWPQGPAGPPATLGATYPVLDEAGLHPNLAPDPDGREIDDDDVDALDVGVGVCSVWYFSADHEATGIDPYSPQPLDPGAIYEVLGPPSYGPQKVIDPQIHLGLLPGTDIDAFEFAWLSPCDTCAPALALLFSVAPNDYLTLNVDESGSLDPQMIYYSFFDGLSYPLLDQPLNDDVDAIATTPLPFLPQSCTSSGMVTWYDDFESYPAGGGIAGLGGWETWANDPTVDGLISPQFALSGIQSLQVGPSTDLVQQFGNANSGWWKFTGRVYVPSGTTGQSHLALLNDYNSSGVIPPEAWSVQIKIDADNTAVSDDFGGQSVPLYTDTWITVHTEIDLANDDVWIYFDGKLLDHRPWTRGAGGALRLAAVDLRTQNSLAFFDDLMLSGADDCNGNGVDDGCDIAAGTSADCNQNGSPDECDMADGTSLDANGNGIPDECEVCVGDLNCDGQVDFGDINPFVLRLSSPAAYAAQYPGCLDANGDINGDASVDFGDINPFVTLLSTSPLPIICP